jgi:hypothetical protein
VLQEEALLRIQDLRLARGQAEEGGVEQVDPLQHRRGPDVARVGQQGGIDSRGTKLLV